MTKLSIIVPAYNSAPFLRRCLDSIWLNKITGPSYLDEVEFIIINDASTDNTAKVLEDYDYKTGFNIVKHSTNWGVAMSRNHGITLAHGDWITFLDADDELYPNAIESMLAQIDNPKYIDRPIVQFNHMRQKGNEAPVLRQSNRAGNYYAQVMPLRWYYVWNKIYNRQFLKANGIRFRENMNYGEDAIFVLECLRANRWIYHANEITVIKHSDNPDSLTKTLTPKRINDFIRAELDLLEQEGNPEEFNALVRELIEEQMRSGTFIRTYGKL